MEKPNHDQGRRRGQTRIEQSLESEKQGWQGLEAAKWGENTCDRGSENSETGGDREETSCRTKHWGKEKGGEQICGTEMNNGKTTKEGEQGMGTLAVEERSWGISSAGKNAWGSISS